MLGSQADPSTIGTAFRSDAANRTAPLHYAGNEVFAALCAMVGLSTSQPCPCRAAQLASPPLMVTALLLMADSVVVMEATNSLVPRAKQNSRLSRCSP